jgi:hypothetical protein
MRRITIGLLSVCLLAGVAAVGVAGAVGSTDSVTTDHGAVPTATAQSEEVWLPEEKVDAVHGNSTRFNVTVPESADGPVTVEIGGESQEYRLVATLRDANDDGTIALEYSAGVDGPETSSLTAVDGDEVSVTNRTALKREGMTAKSYEFRLANGTSADGETLDTGAFGVVFDATHIDLSDDWFSARQVTADVDGTTSFEIEFQSDASESATLAIDGPGYLLVATVTDENGDGTVAVEYDVGAAGTDGTPITADGEDTVSVVRETRLDGEGGLEPGSYDMNLTRGTPPDGEEVDISYLRVINTPSNEQPETYDGSWFETKTPTADWREEAFVRVDLEPDADGSVTISVGDGDPYLLVATLRDGNQDGEVHVKFDTAVAGTGANPLSVGRGDSVVVHRQSNRSGAGLPPGEYDMNLSLGRPPDGEEVSVGTLIHDTRDNVPEGTSATEKAAETGTEWTWGNRDDVLSNGIVTTHRGQPAHIPLEVRPGTTVTLQIRRPGTPDKYVVEVHDADGSGRVPLLFRTSAVDTGSHRVAVQGDNEVTLREGAGDTDAIAVGILDIDVYNGSGISGEEIGVGTLQLLEPTNDSANGTTTAPTDTPTPGPSIANNDSSDGDELGALAAIAVGGILAVVGVAVLFGVRRQ